MLAHDHSTSILILIHIFIHIHIHRLSTEYEVEADVELDLDSDLDLGLDLDLDLELEFCSCNSLPSSYPFCLIRKSSSILCVSNRQAENKCSQRQITWKTEQPQPQPQPSICVSEILLLLPTSCLSCDTSPRATGTPQRHVSDEHSA